MFRLILQKRGYLSTKNWKYNKKTDTGNWEIKTLKTNNILNFLKYEIELEEGYTLRDWFNLIMNYSDLQKIDNYFDSFLEEFKSCPLEKCVSIDMLYLQIRKIIDIEILENEMEVYNDFNGLDNKNVSLGLDFLPLDKYIDTPLKLEKGLVSYKNNYKQYKISYTLWDILHSIIWEISFHGTPKERGDKERRLLKDNIMKIG